jgi:hypothetical protein
MFDCPVCLYAEMPEPPQDYHICPCCGTEFGNDDVDSTYAELRDHWIRAGAPWFFRQPPANWSPWAQLLHGPFGVETQVVALPTHADVQADVQAEDANFTYAYA